MMMSRIRSSRLTPSSVKPVIPAREAASTANSMVPLTNRRIATSKLPITMSSRAGASTANWTAAAPRRSRIRRPSRVIHIADYCAIRRLLSCIPMVRKTVRSVALSGE